MYTRSFILFPFGFAEGDVPDAGGGAHEFCVRCVTRCCETPPSLMINSTHEVSDFFPLLKEREVDVRSPQSQLVVVLTRSQPVNFLFGARSRLIGACAPLEDAMWIIYAGQFIETFRRIALRCGTIDGHMDAFPTWKTSSYGSFLILTPQLVDTNHLDFGARRHRRNVTQQVGHAQKSGSMPRMGAVRSSRGISGMMPAIILPTDDSSNKKP